MPRPAASATASRFARYWAAEALAGDDSLDFSVTKAVVGASQDSLTGAPEAVRERVALRCLREVVSLSASEGDAAAAPEEAVLAAGMLRVDASRTCEDLLLELIREVGSSGSLEKGMLLPFSHEIKNFICIKGPTLPETSFEMLREVHPEITPVVPPSPVGQNGNDQHDNVSHGLENTERIGINIDGAQLQQDDLANLVSESNSENRQKDTMATTDFHQPSTSDNRCFDQPQEDSIAVGVNIRSLKDSPNNVDRHISAAAEPSLTSSADLLGSNTGTISERGMIDHTAMVQLQSWGIKNPYTLHYNNGDGPLDASIQPPKHSIHEGPTMQAIVSPAFDRSNDALSASTSETSHLPEYITAEDTVMTSEPHISKPHPNSPQHDTGYKANQDVDCGSVPIQKAVAFLSEGFNGPIQGKKSVIKDPPENTTEHMQMPEQENSDKAPHLEVGCFNKVNQALHDDGNIMKKNMVCDGLNVQIAPESHSCSMALHNKNSEVNHHLSEQNIGRNTTAIQKDCFSILTSSQDVNDTGANQSSNKRTVGNTGAETSHVHSSDDSLSGFAAAGLLSMTDKIPFCTQDQDANGPVEGSSEQDLCIKCGKDGQLLKCNSCLLAAHDICFGSSVTFDDSGQFYCPVCFYTKATEAYQKAKKTYSEARKNLSAFLGRKQLAEKHEQQNVVWQRSANSEDHLNGCNNSSKRQGNHLSEGNNLSHRDEEPTWQRKKQKTNATGDACAQEVVTEKEPIQNSDVAHMNKHSVLQNNKKQAPVAEHDQPEENAEASRSGNDNSSHKTTHSSQNKCSPANQNVDADKEDGLASSQRSEESDEIEATSSNDSSKQSSPPWHKLRHGKARYQDKDAAVPSNSKKSLGHPEQHMASPSRKRNYAYPPKRYSNPVGLAGRRTKLCWTEQEETILREAMAKFTPSDNGPIPWVQILEYGREVFHRTRLPPDLRVKWRNMKKKSGY